MDEERRNGLLMYLGNRCFAPGWRRTIIQLTQIPPQSLRSSHCRSSLFFTTRTFSLRTTFPTLVDGPLLACWKISPRKTSLGAISSCCCIQSSPRCSCTPNSTEAKPKVRMENIKTGRQAHTTGGTIKT